MERDWNAYVVYTVVVVGTEMVVAGTVVVGMVVEDMPMEKSTK
jgi:hypothetical protein